MQDAILYRVSKKNLISLGMQLSRELQKFKYSYGYTENGNRDLVNKPIRTILLCKSSFVILLNVACVIATAFQQELVSNSCK